jgi:hypothetical protein
VRRRRERRGEVEVEGVAVAEVSLGIVPSLSGMDEPGGGESARRWLANVTLVTGGGGAYHREVAGCG